MKYYYAKEYFLMCFLLMVFAGNLDAQCRMSQNELKPIVERYNPFFTDHTWDDLDKLETARLDPHRLVVIRQKACLRHHVMLSLMLDESVVHDSKRYWISEALITMKRVFFQNTEYLAYKKEFEKEFIRGFLANGTNERFNFPIGGRTFQCEIQYGDWGAKVNLNVVKLIIKERIKFPGIARENDDGWKKPEANRP